MATRAAQLLSRGALACALLCASMSMTACAAPAWDGQGAYYNFGWRISGNAAIAPVQVFDDGSKIYLQFPQGVTLPAIFEEGPAGPILVAPTQQMPYFVIDRFSGRLQFRIGSSIAYAQRDNAGSGAPQGVYTGAAAPQSVTGSAQAPVARATYLANQAMSTPVYAPKTTVEPISPYASTGGIAAGQTGFGAPPAALPYYTLLPSDQTVSQAFKRWATGTGWEIRWGSAAVARITGTTQVQGPLLHAVIAVVDGLKQAGYPVSEQWDLPNQRLVVADGSGNGSDTGSTSETAQTPRQETHASHRVTLKRRKSGHAAPRASEHAAPVREEPTHIAAPSPIAGQSASASVPAASSNKPIAASAPLARSAGSKDAASVFDDPLSGKSNQSSRSAF